MKKYCKKHKKITIHELLQGYFYGIFFSEWYCKKCITKDINQFLIKTLK